MHFIYIVKNIVLGFLFSKKIHDREAVFLSGGLGDTFYALLYIDEYVKKKEQENIAVYISDKQHDIVKICNPKHVQIKSYNGRNRSAFHYYLTLMNRIFPRYKYLNLEPAILGKKLKLYTEKHNFEQVFYYDLMGLNGDMHVDLQTRTDVFPENKILIIPDSNTIRTFTDRFWYSLINFVKSNYDCMVYVNQSIHLYHEDVSGVNCYSKGIYDLFHDAGSFKCIISIRNGMCDIIAKQKCNLIVLYPAEYHGKNPMKAYSLQDMDKSCQLNEIVVKNGESFDSIKEIGKRVKVFMQ